MRASGIKVTRVFIDEFSKLSEVYTYLITRNGQRMAHIWTDIEGDTLQIVHIDDLEGGGPRSLGVLGIRQVLRALAKKHPDVKYIAGEGVADPRGIGSGQPIEVEVSRLG